MLTWNQVGSGVYWDMHRYMLSNYSVYLPVFCQHILTSVVIYRVTTHLENLEKSGNSKVVRGNLCLPLLEKSGNLRENGKSQGK